MEIEKISNRKMLNESEDEDFIADSISDMTEGTEHIKVYTENDRKNMKEYIVRRRKILNIPKVELPRWMRYS